jgi:hypothetical protein
MLDWEDPNAVQRRRQNDKAEALIGEIRKLPGFDRFLLSKPISDLKLSAVRGPVVILLSDRESPLAMILANPVDDVKCVHLKNLSTILLRRMATFVWDTNLKRGRGRPHGQQTSRGRVATPIKQVQIHCQRFGHLH